MGFNPLTIFWVVWKERNRRAFERVEDINGFDILNNKWFQTLDFLLQSHPLSSMEDVTELVAMLIDT